ncbi:MULTISPECIES: WhiB family transcriptional regulator [Amycolatopsis]|uniref:WhiB family transcriptional regulator n=1 Tax=Amycolatopsis TaxID=1813 RepID=UPI003571621E
MPRRERTFNAWRCSAPVHAAGEPTTDTPYGRQRGPVASTGTPPDPEQLACCRAVCAGCEVREPRLASALTHHDPWGLWGGLSPDEREQIAGTDAVRILPSHGTNPRYSKHRCRCTLCRIAHSAYERNRRHQSRLRQQK